MARPFNHDAGIGDRQHDDAQQFVMALQRTIVLHFPPNRVPDVLLTALEDAKAAVEVSTTKLKNLCTMMARNGFTTDDIAR